LAGRAREGIGALHGRTLDFHYAAVAMGFQRPADLKAVPHIAPLIGGFASAIERGAGGELDEALPLALTEF
jgi:hypothetical protein